MVAKSSVAIEFLENMKDEQEFSLYIENLCTSLRKRGCTDKAEIVENLYRERLEENSKEDKNEIKFLEHPLKYRLSLSTKEDLDLVENFDNKIMHPTQKEAFFTFIEKVKAKKAFLHSCFKVKNGEGNFNHCIVARAVASYLALPLFESNYIDGDDFDILFELLKEEKGVIYIPEVSSASYDKVYEKTKNARHKVFLNSKKTDWLCISSKIIE